MTLRKKLLITIACLSCILCVLVTGTVAWLIDETDPVKNTFVPSNIAVKLTETSMAVGDNKMIPGTTLAVAPKVEVEADISCYVFVVVSKSDNLDTYIDWVVAEGWESVSGVAGVYYREITTDTSVTETYSVLKDDKVTVKDTVTKEDMDALYDDDGIVKRESLPTLSFAAYACQSEGFDNVEAAWAEVTKDPAAT